MLNFKIFSSLEKDTEGIKVNCNVLHLGNLLKSISGFEWKFLLTVSLWFTFPNSMTIKRIVEDVGKYSLVEQTF